MRVSECAESRWPMIRIPSIFDPDFDKLSSRSRAVSAGCCPSGGCAPTAPVAASAGTGSNPFVNFYRGFDGKFDAREIQVQGKEIIKDLAKYGGGIVSIQKGETGATADQRKALAEQLKTLSKEFADFSEIAAKGVAPPS